MLERESQIAAEQVDVNPSQQSFLLNNQADLTSPTESLIGDTNKVVKELNDQLASNPRFLAVMRDNTIPEAKNFRAIRSLLNDRNHAVLIKKYGNEYERREGLMDLELRDAGFVDERKTKRIDEGARRWRSARN